LGTWKCQNAYAGDRQSSWTPRRPPAHCLCGIEQTHRAVSEKLDELVSTDRLISPQEVYEELREKKDAVARWALRRKKSTRLFIKTTQQMARIAKQLIHRFPDFVEFDRPVSQADPFVMALAIFEGRKALGQRCVVVTEEKYTPTGRPRIPHVCEVFQISYMTIHQMYVSHGWSF
jgi:hypothetical protein